MFSSTFIMQSHCHYSPFTSIESLSKLYWNFMECPPITSPSPMPLCTYVARWAMKGVNVWIASTCACMHWNLTWLDKTHSFTVWEGFNVGCGAWLSSLCSDVLFQLCLDPIPQWGGVGGLGPPLQLQGGPGGVAAPPKGIFYKKCLVKYCNFIVNLDCSLCHRSDDRSYINLGF